MRIISKSLFILLLLGFYSMPVQAHQLWINMTDYTPSIWQHPKYAPEPRAKTIAYFGWGHKYPVADFPDKKYLETMYQFEPDGSKIEIKPGESGFRAVEIEMKTKGARIFTASVNPGFYQEIKGKKDFFELRYEMYCKALVSTGEIIGNPFKKAIGHKVEIIPLQNPNKIKPGEKLSIKVLLNNKPAPDFNIKAIPMYSGTGESEETKTDKSGKSEISINKYYGPWLITASRTDPSTGALKKKCNSFFYTATMTFAVEK